MDEGKPSFLYPSFFSIYPSTVVHGDSHPILSFFLRRINNKFRHTAPKSRTSSVAKTGFVVSLVSPTSNPRPNPSPTLLPPTQPQLVPPPDPDQNRMSVPLHCLQTPTGALLSYPTIDTPKLTSPPRVSRPPYQVSFTALPPPLYSPLCRLDH